MEDLFKKFLYTGVGLVAMTTEKIQKSVDKLISDGKLSIEEGKNIIDKLVKEGRLSTDEGKKVIEDLVEKGKLSAEEGKKAIDEFLKNAKSKRSEVETQIKGIVERVLSSFDYATAKEVEDLKKRIAVLEKKLKASSKPAAKAVKKAPAKTKDTVTA